MQRWYLNYICIKKFYRCSPAIAGVNCRNIHNVPIRDNVKPLDITATETNESFVNMHFITVVNNVQILLNHSCISNAVYFLKVSCNKRIK